MILGKASKRKIMAELAKKNTINESNAINENFVKFDDSKVSAKHMIVRLRFAYKIAWKIKFFILWCQF